MTTYRPADYDGDIAALQIVPVTGKPVVQELSQADRDIILALEVITEESVKHATQTSRAQAKIWIEQLVADGSIKTEAELIAAKE